MTVAFNMDAMAAFLRWYSSYTEVGIIATDGDSFKFESEGAFESWCAFKAGRDSVNVVTVPVVNDWQMVNEAARG